MRYCSPKKWEAFAKNIPDKYKDSCDAMFIYTEAVQTGQFSLNSIQAICTVDRIQSEIQKIRLFVNDFAHKPEHFTVYVYTIHCCIVEFDLFEASDKDLADMCTDMLFTPMHTATTTFF